MLPIFALFQSDRTSKDSDGEVQNPIKAAVAAAIAEVGAEIAQIQSKVQQKAEEIAKNTLGSTKNYRFTTCRGANTRVCSPFPR